MLKYFFFLKQSNYILTHVFETKLTIEMKTEPHTTLAKLSLDLEW